jgi:hypothetical protein
MSVVMPCMLLAIVCFPNDGYVALGVMFGFGHVMTEYVSPRLVKRLMRQSANQDDSPIQGSSPESRPRDGAEREGGSESPGDPQDEFKN